MQEEEAALPVGGEPASLSAVHQFVLVVHELLLLVPLHSAFWVPIPMETDDSDDDDGAPAGAQPSPTGRSPHPHDSHAEWTEGV